MTMIRHAICLALGAAAPAWASGPSALIDLPVVASVVVPASQYQARMPPAASMVSALDAALHVAGTFEGLRQVIVQTHDTPESPSVSRVVILRDGLLDDAVHTQRLELALARTSAGGWQVTEMKKSWRCRRGEAPFQFDVRPCP